MSNRKSTRRFCPFKRSNLLLSSSGSSDFPAQLLNQISIQSHRCPLCPCVSCSPSFESPKRFFDVGCPCVIRPLVRQPPTAMASGSKNTDITDAHGFIITDRLFLFDGPLDLWILDGFFAYQGRVTLSSSLLNEAGWKVKVAHSPVEPSGLKAQWPPQPRVSEATPWVNRHVTLRPVGAKANITRSVSAFCHCMAQATRPIIPRASLRLPLGYGLLPPSGRVFKI